MRVADICLVTIVAVALPGAASAAPRVAFAIPAGSVGSAAIAIAQQANVTVAVTDRALAQRPAAGFRGQMTVAAALARLLHGLPARIDRIDDATWRIMAAAPAAMPPPAKAPILTTPTAPVDTGGDLIVTGSKTGTRYRDYAGTAQIIAGAALDAGAAAAGSEALTRLLPSLAQTHLGSGRNKLFIRGIADSSFNGPSQATVGEYLGDVRLNYNAPDPDLSLYDIEAVEVLEGPQGTLYGAGTLGGVIRIVPTRVDLTQDSLDLSAGLSGTAHGAPGRDAAMVANLVADPDRAGIRLVAFDTIEGGYIDDPSRGLSNINRTRKTGGRIAARYAPGAWRIDAGAILQNVTTRDGQYADGRLAHLQRSSRTPQPFDNDYLLGHLTVSRDWGSLHLVSATGLVRQSVDSRYDFTPAGAPAPTIFDQGNHISLVTNETRLSRHDAEGAGWVLGASLLHDSERLTRALGPPSNPTRILGLSNSVTEGAVFGEWGVRLLPHVIATAGLRGQYTRLVGEALDGSADVGEPRRNEYSLLPSLSLSWHPRRVATLYIRYQEGSRPGGLSITPGSPEPTVERFHGDTLASLEAGGRFESDRIEVGASLSFARWENIQADLVDMAGLPFTANIGSGRIWGAEGHVVWRPWRTLRLSAAVFGNDSQLTDPPPGFTAQTEPELPNVAHIGLRGGIDYAADLAGGWRIEAGASARYVGHSRLGIGSLDLLQGDYTLAAFSSRLGTKRWGLSLDVDNLLNGRGSTFALGNPYNVAAGNQIVPPRPRTVRIGMDLHF